MYFSSAVYLFYSQIEAFFLCNTVSRYASGNTIQKTDLGHLGIPHDSRSFLFRSAARQT